MMFGNKLGRKFLMQTGVSVQCICLLLMATLAYSDWINELFFPILVVYIMAFSIGMEACGIIFTCEILPQCAVPWAMYSQWIAGCLICFGNYLALKTSDQLVYSVFGGCCFFAFFFIGLMFRETKGMDVNQIQNSYSKKVQVKFCM